jgi:hypothetical protein
MCQAAWKKRAGYHIHRRGGYQRVRRERVEVLRGAEGNGIVIRLIVSSKKQRPSH